MGHESDLEIERADVPTHVNEKGGDESDENFGSTPDMDTIEGAVREGKSISPEMWEKVATYYAIVANQEETVAPRADVDAIIERILAMDDNEAVDVLVEAIAFHRVRAHFFLISLREVRIRAC